jgi:hypothetical protein
MNEDPVQHSVPEVVCLLRHPRWRLQRSDDSRGLGLGSQPHRWIEERRHDQAPCPQARRAGVFAATSLAVGSIEGRFAYNHANPREPSLLTDRARVTCAL